MSRDCLTHSSSKTWQTDVTFYKFYTRYNIIRNKSNSLHGAASCFGKLEISQLLKILSSFMDTLCSPCYIHKSPPLPPIFRQSNHSTTSHVIFLRSTFILFPHVRHEIPSRLFLSEFWTRISCARHIFRQYTFIKVAEFRYFGTILIHQNWIRKEVKFRFNSGNVCYLKFRIFLSLRPLWNWQSLIYTRI
jgi:hypothetical protein